MAIPLARRNLVHQWMRTLVGLAGISVALTLIFLQLGFMGAVRSTARLILDRLAGEVAIVSHDYQHFFAAGEFPKNRLTTASGYSGATNTSEILLATGIWRSPDAVDPLEGSRRAIFVIGLSPRSDGEMAAALLIPELETFGHRLSEPMRVLVDSATRREFFAGRLPSEDLFKEPVGWELAGQMVYPVGLFRMGTGFGADGAVLVSSETFNSLFPWHEPENISMGVIKLSAGIDPDDWAQKVNSELPDDCIVISKNKLIEQEVKHWVTNTSVGIIFTFGVVVAFFVGVGVVYQVLASDIAHHQAEYATLKAIGYSNNYLSRIVLEQSVFLALLGFIPSVFVASLLFEFTRERANILMALTWPLMAFVLLLALAMCLTSGMLAMRKIQQADPATLF